MDVSLAAIKSSALSLELLCFISCFGLFRKSLAPMTSVQLGVRLALCALPFGIICSIAARSVDASGYGISIMPVAIFFMLKGIIAREGFDPAEIVARRQRILKKFLGRKKP